MADSPSASRRAERRRPAKLTAEEILAAIRRWHDRYGEPPTMADWDPARARAMGQHWRIARYDEGDWPSARTVRNHFGRMSMAVAAAGLVPRWQGQQRAQPEMALDRATLLHLAHLEAMRDNQPTDLVFAAAVREVSRARESEHPLDLRVALIDLAAAALRWARATEHDLPRDEVRV